MYQILAWSTTCCIVCEEQKKKFEVRRDKNFITLSYAKIKHTAKYGFAVCQKKHTTKYDFVVCQIFAGCAHGKQPFCRVPYGKHTANYRAHDKELDSGSEHKALYRTK